ncbi:MAG: hypothetical protein J0L93_09005 [Deltaproteobacteria bacterium]|nr:hypothetical protein [Deltaproteobacteria bacterium]
MKIQNNRGVVSIDAKLNADRNAKVKSGAADSAQEKTKSDSVDTRVSQALSQALEQISQSGLSAGDVHSEVDEKKIAGLLNSFEVDSKRSRMSDQDLEKMADKVSTEMKANPQAASRAFKSIEADRVAELV